MPASSLVQKRGRERRTALVGISDRVLFDALKANGHQELARELNPIMAKSKRDKLGAIVVRAHSGADNTTAYRVAKEFEDRAGGKEGVAERLEVLGPALPEGMRALPDVLRKPENASKALYRVLAEQKASLLQVMKYYAKGCVELAQVEAAIEAHRGMPAIVKDLVRHALDKEEVCHTCLGVGAVRNKSTDNKETLPCPSCAGAGRTVQSSPHKEFASKTVLEMTKQISGGKGTEVNVAVGINMAGGGKSYAERMIDAADKVLYGRRDAGGAGEVVDVEAVPVQEVTTE